jgi:RecJ-like exonuclease
MGIGSRRGHRLRTRLWLAGMTGLLLAAKCGDTKKIKELLDDPSRYEGKTVQIAGEVKHSAGVLGAGLYEVDDGTGSLPVVSQSGGAPREGSKVGVEGVFRAAYTFGARTGAVLVESKRYEP